MNQQILFLIFKVIAMNVSDGKNKFQSVWLLYFFKILHALKFVIGLDEIKKKII
jgi:hypothetical protein